MLIGYARVSKDEQSLEKQIDILTQHGVDKRNIYQEKITGTIKERPELTRMLEELEKGDIVIVQDITRLSRSTKHLLETVESIKEKGAYIKSIQDIWLDTSRASEDPQQQFLLTVMAGLSQLERDLNSRRTKESLAAARKRGIVGGRPKKSSEDIRKALDLYKTKKFSIQEIENMSKVSKTTLYRYLKNV
jgi:DNA invertase Pin-like site-specific DNA recombinase